MSENSTTLPPGAGATTRSNSPDPFDINSGASGNFGTGGSTIDTTEATRRADAFTASSVSQDESPTEYLPRDRALIVTTETSDKPSTATVIGAALVGALAGATIPFLFAGRSAPRQHRREDEVFQAVTVNRPAFELYNFWRDFTNLPQFMDNIKSVEKLDNRRSHWVIKAPAGTSVEFDSRITQDVPGRLIAWESEEGASVPNRGRVEFEESSVPGATVVRATIFFEPPAGAAGRMVAKLFQRDPEEQAQEDLARFRDLMEGTVR